MGFKKENEAIIYVFLLETVNFTSFAPGFIKIYCGKQQILSLPYLQTPGSMSLDRSDISDISAE